MASARANGRSEEERHTDAAGRCFHVRRVEGAVATVVLLGWLGAKDRHLAKYADMYEEMGVSSVRVIGAELDCFLFWSRNAEMVVHAIGLAQENSGSSPILCHAFSNGGCSGISSLFASVREGKSSSGALSEKAGLYMAAVEAVSAWVFDSCPAFLKTDGSPGRALAVGIPNPVVAWVAEASLNALLGFLVTCCDPTVPQQFWDAFVHAPTQAPQLYIYSDSDDLTDSGYLDALLPQRRAAGVPVHAVKLQESPHVTHLRKAPRAYRTAVAVLLASITEGGIAAKAAAEPFLASGEAQPLRLADDTPAYQSARWVPLPGGDGGVLNVWLPKEAQDVAGQGGGIGVAKL